MSEKIKTRQYLSPKQKAILDFIKKNLDIFGYAPTQREISKATGLTRSLILYHLHRLETLGVIELKNQHGRNIDVVDN